MMVERATTTTLPDISGTRALVYSLGIEGRDLARWLLAHGASVTMADSRTAEQLEAAGATAPEGVERTIRGELLDPKGFDLLAVSQSVLRSHPNVLRARQLAIPVVSQMALALRLCRGRVVGITGSSGKSTTTALVGAMAESAGIEHLVGGNLGGSLLDRIEAVPETATVILEISHTQLQYTDRSPAVVAVTNVTPNHLDQFSWPEYVDLKRNILRYQDADGLAILNADDDTSRALRADVQGRLAEVSLAGPVGGDGAWLDGDAIVSRWGGAPETVAATGDLRMRGRHNVANAVMAIAIARAMGLQSEAIADALQRFPGCPTACRLSDGRTEPSGSTTASRPRRSGPWRRWRRCRRPPSCCSAGARRRCRWKSCAPPPGSAAARPSASGKRPHRSRRRWRGPWTRSRA